MTVALNNAPKTAITTVLAKTENATVSSHTQVIPAISYSALNSAQETENALQTAVFATQAGKAKIALLLNAQTVTTMVNVTLKLDYVYAIKVISHLTVLLINAPITAQITVNVIISNVYATKVMKVQIVGIKNAPKLA